MRSPPRRPAKGPAGVSRAAGSDRLLLVLVALITIGVLASPMVLAELGRSSPRKDLHVATGYNQIVDEIFGKKGWLIGHRDDDTDDRKVVTISRRIKSSIYAFYRNSFLRRDVQDDDPTRWRFQGRQVLGVDENAHSVAGPFAVGRLWRGDVLFRGAPRAETALQSATETLVLVPPAAGWRAEQPPPAPGEATPFTANGATVKPEAKRSQAFRILDEDGVLMASALLVGDAVVIRVESGAPGKVWVNQSELAPKAERAVYRRLLPGQALRLMEVSGRQAQYVLSDSTFAISDFWPPDTRKPDPSNAPLATGIGDAMNRMTQQDADPDRWTSRDVKTTIDEAVQHDVQDSLATYCRKLRDEIPGAHTFRAAALVMDAKTGEILAAASFPSVAKDLTPAEQYSRPGRALLSRNHNFTRLPIGSVAKIPFSMAILNTFPYLSTLRITGAKGVKGEEGLGFDTLLGQRLEAKLPEESPVGDIGFEDFIRTSSNKYGSALMLLASAPDPRAKGTISAGEGYRLDGTPHPMLPAGSFSTKVTPTGVHFIRPSAGSAISGLRWVTNLDTLFDIPHYAGVGGRGDPGRDEGDDVYDLASWRYLIGQRRDAPMRGFIDVAPERESFAMGVMRNLRNDYLQLILGGGRSRWTTVKVAEVFSRIVTGRAIKATLMLPAVAATAPPLPFLQTPRDTLLRAMEQVWNAEGGTARRFLEPPILSLQKRVPAGETLRVFAKTGTPTLERIPRSKSNEAVDELMGLRIINIDEESGLARVRRAASQTKADMIRALGDDPDARDVLAEYGVSAKQAVDHLTYVNTKRRDLLIRTEEGDGVGPDLKPERGDGGVIAFTMARFQGGNPEPVRALTVVVNIQAKVPRGVGLARPNPATEFAGEWLKRPPLGNLLFQDLEGANVASAAARR